MNLIELIILWLSASGCLAKILAPTSDVSERAGLADAAVEIVSSCYLKESNVVGLAGALDNVLFEKLTSRQYLQVAVISKDTSKKPLDPVLPRPKLQVFVVTASSSKQFDNALRGITRSQWWNHMATFLIIDWSSITDDECSNAYSFLWTAWQRNVLKAFYVCLDRTKGRLIYSFNPFMSRAPLSWQPVTTWEGRMYPSRSWTLFRRGYDGDDRICVNLEFDKTSDLGGYTINTGHEETGPLRLIKDNAASETTTPYLLRVIFQALNASARREEYMKRYNNNFRVETAKDISHGIIDVLLDPTDYSCLERFPGSKVYILEELVMLTRYSGQQSPLDNFLTVLDRSSRFSLCLVFVMTVIFFKCFQRQPSGSAILNVFRIATYSSLTKVPNGQAARFYLAGVFFLVVAIIGIYQGKLASLLTKRISKPNVETCDDAIDRGYRVDNHWSTASLLRETPEFQDSYIPVGVDDCEEEVGRDPSVACVIPRRLLTEKAIKFKLHVSACRESLRVFMIRQNWPLEDRFNWILTALVESNIAQYITMAKPLEILRRAKLQESQEKDKFKAIVLSDLTFAFVTLGIGLGCATVCFVAEIAVTKFRKKNRV